MIDLRVVPTCNDKWTLLAVHSVQGIVTVLYDHSIVNLVTLWLFAAEDTRTILLLTSYSEHELYHRYVSPFHMA